MFLRAETCSDPAISSKALFHEARVFTPMADRRASLCCVRVSSTELSYTAGQKTARFFFPRDLFIQLGYKSDISNTFLCFPWPRGVALTNHEIQWALPPRGGNINELTVFSRSCQNAPRWSKWVLRVPLSLQ